MRQDFRYKCKKCGIILSVNNFPEDETKFDINILLVLACLTIGIGFFQLEEFLDFLNAKSPCNDFYQTLQTKLYPEIKKAAKASTQK